MSSRYWQLMLVSPLDASAALTSFFRELGALGVLEQPLDESRSSLTALFEDTLDRNDLFDRVRAHLGDLTARGIEISGRVRISPITSDGWAEAWPEYFVPTEVGRRLQVVPSWIRPTMRDRVVIAIEPGGFGTGHHPSTIGCLEAIESIVERERPERAIDLGTGSGILAIAAARLGVTRVIAVDDDPAAVACASANATRNGVGDRVRSERADAERAEMDSAPLVVANLLAPVHARLAHRYAGLVARGGSLVLGGIQDVEGSAVIDAVAPEGFALCDQITRDGWTTLVFSRAS